MVTSLWNNVLLELFEFHQHDQMLNQNHKRDARFQKNNDQIMLNQDFISMGRAPTQGSLSVCSSVPFKQLCLKRFNNREFPSRSTENILLGFKNLMLYSLKYKQCRPIQCKLYAMANFQSSNAHCTLTLLQNVSYVQYNQYS